MKRLVLLGIRLYQRHLSPRKGFVCAYRVHTGRCSCSTLGYRAIRARGVWAGTRLLLQRTHLCGVAHRRHSPRHPPLRHLAQRGHCDVSCDLPCDGPCQATDLLDPACEAASWCNGCDRPGSRKTHGERRNEEEGIHLPPLRSGR